MKKLLLTLILIFGLTPVAICGPPASAPQTATLAESDVTQYANELADVITSGHINIVLDTSPQLGGNLDLNEKLLTEDEYQITSGSTIDLSGHGSVIEVAYSGATTLSAFSNITADADYTILFTNGNATVDFTGTNLYGHGGIDWEPASGDSMQCHAIDSTYMYCRVSRSSALSISQYNEMPFDLKPDSDDSWSGPMASDSSSTNYPAGENLSQWDLVYIAHDAGSPEWKKWDADGAAKTLKPIGVVVESGGILDTEYGDIGIGFGIARNDGWAFTDNQDEGLPIWGDDDTAGNLVVDDDPEHFLDTGDMACQVGILMDEDEIMFNFAYCGLEEIP